MNLKTPFPSYAQYNEDIILLALLHDVENGFYVDVGANYPVIDSVTKLFYQHGWRGINIEPITSLYNQLKKDRPEDINLNIGIGEKMGEFVFYENVNMPGHSSFKKPANTTGVNISKYKIPVKTLKSVFVNQHVKDVHFLKIDVEGFEDEVIASNDWNKYRPKVLCIESGLKNSKYRRILKDAKYKLFIKDGLNEYYVANESWYRTKGFEERVVGFSYNSLRYHHYRSWSENLKQLKRVTKLNRIHYEEVVRVKKENSLYFKNVKYWARLKRTICGLSIKLFRYKKNTLKK